MSYNITADSLPDFDEWGWDNYWSPDDWIEWHKAMKKKYGLSYANKKFIEQWNLNTFGASVLDARTFNSSFKNYAKLNKFYDNLFTGAGVFEPILKGASTVTTVTDKAGNAIENVATAAEKTTKATSYILPIAIGALFLGAGFYAYNHYIKK